MRVVPLALIPFVAVLWITPSASRAADPETSIQWHSDVHAAWKTSVRQDRPLLIYLTMPACYYCEVMKEQTYRDLAVAEEINRSFVAVSVASGQADRLTKVLNVQSYPTTVVISPDVDVLARFDGYVSAKEFHRKLAAIAAEKSVVTKSTVQKSAVKPGARNTK